MDFFPNLYRPKNFSRKFYLSENLRVVHTQAIFKISVGKRRIRHKMTQNLDEFFFNRF